MLHQIAIEPKIFNALTTFGDPIPGALGVETDSTAVICIRGPMSHRPRGFFDFLFGGGATYEEIRSTFKAAIADDSVRSILFDIDSPGGEVAGLFDLVDEIYNARRTKPIYAIANESALSAAYAIASAADMIYLPRTAKVGSIGVMAVHMDQSEAEKKAGLKFTPIYAGERKNDFSPHSPLSKEAFEVAKASVNQTYDLFVETVARNTGNSAKQIRDTQAAIYTGADAINHGLADDVFSYNQLIQHIERGNSMSLKTDLRKLLAGKKPEEIAEAMAAVNFVPQDASATETAKEILGIAELAGVTDLSFIMGLVNEGITPDKAREKILEAKADTANKQIFSTVSATGIGEVNPLLKDAQRRVGKDGEK